jgi:hypothetical protein
MSLGNVFVNSVVKEIGRNYGRAVSNTLLGDAHAIPVRTLGAGTGGRNYKNALHKICETWTIKGPTATFNVGQNMYKAFFDLVEEAQQDGRVSLEELRQLVVEWADFRKEYLKVIEALRQLEDHKKADTLNEMDDAIFEFFIEINNQLIVPETPEEMPPRPKGFFNNKAKGEWIRENRRREIMKKIVGLATSTKETLNRWEKDYNEAKKNGE